MNVAPPQGTGCGATVAECFRKVPMKTEMVDKAIAVLDTGHAEPPQRPRLDAAGGTPQPDTGHILEYERAIYEVIEPTRPSRPRPWLAADKRALMVLTADHAQPQTIIGVALTGALVGQAGGFVFHDLGRQLPITLGSTDDKDRPARCRMRSAPSTTRPS